MYDVYELRKQFPMLNSNKTMQGKPLVYLDNASTTLKPQCVIDAVNRYNSEITANSHRGDYDLCYQMDMEVLKARQAIAKFINSEVNEVIFTSGDTESLNLIAYGYALKFLCEDDGILISESEHASNVLPWFRISKLTGCKIYYIKPENNRITPSAVADALQEHDNIKLVAIAHVGNVLGYRAEIKKIGWICHEFGALLAVDGAQSVPHIKTDFKDLDIDFLTFSSHKMCGPTGIGALVARHEILEMMDPFITGGGMNITFKSDGTCEPLEAPAKFEAGSLNLAGIIGFRAAVEFLESVGMDNIEQHEKELHTYLVNKIKDCKDLIIYNIDNESGIFTFNRVGVFAQDEATLLNSKGIAVRSGQHCAKMIDALIGTPATVRMSTYLYTTKEEIDVFVDALVNGGDILDAYFND